MPDDDLEALKARIAKLEEAAKPPEPSEPWVWQKPDYTANARMPDSVLREMLAAVPESVMAGIRADARKPNPVTQASSSPLTTTPSTQSQPQRRGTGWVPERPLESPPGLKYVDAQVDAQDAKDRAELALKLAKARMVGKGETK